MFGASYVPPYFSGFKNLTLGLFVILLPRTFDSSGNVYSVAPSSGLTYVRSSNVITPLLPPCKNPCGTPPNSSFNIEFLKSSNKDLFIPSIIVLTDSKLTAILIGHESSNIFLNIRFL